jgi:hypothetical protein
MSTSRVISRAAAADARMFACAWTAISGPFMLPLRPWSG